MSYWMNSLTGTVFCLDSDERPEPYRDVTGKRVVYLRVNRDTYLRYCHKMGMEPC